MAAWAAARPLAIVLLSLPAVAAEGPLSVSWDAGRLSVRGEGARLVDVLGEVARQTGIAVQGAEALQERVSMRFEGLALREGLEALLAGKDHLIVGDLSMTPGQPRVRVIVLEPRAGPSVAEGPEKLEDDVPAEAALEVDEPGGEIAALEEESPSDAEIVAEEEGPEAREMTGEPAALAGLEAPSSGELAAPVAEVEVPRASPLEESPAMEEPGMTIAVPEREPESGVEIHGGGVDEPD